jgi:hypothetical protein
VDECHSPLPYGVCVPCANGYYKPLPGAHNCTECPAQMDTMWEGGEPRGNWSTLTGEARPGHLGRALQLDSTKTRVESAYGFSACS